MIVDTPPGFTPEVIASVDSSTHVCMVGMLDSLSLKNTKLGLETLELMGYEGERINLVLNRADSHVGITHDDVRTVVGREPDVLVPSHRDIARSANMGAPIVTRGSALGGRQGLPRARRVLSQRHAGERRREHEGSGQGERAKPAAATEEEGLMQLHERLSKGSQPAVGRERDPFAEVKNRIHFAVIGSLGPELFNADMDASHMRERVLADIKSQLDAEAGIAREDRERLVGEIADDILGHGPLERPLADDSVTEIMINGPFDVWVEREGRLSQTAVRFTDESHLRRVINKIVAQVGRRIDESSPMVDARLPDGSRVNAVLPPLSLSGPLVTIRKFSKRRLDARRHDQARHAEPRDDRLPRSLRSGAS